MGPRGWKYTLTRDFGKNMSLQDKKISLRKTQKNTMKNEFDLNGSFRGAFKILINHFLGKSTIPDRSK